MHNPMGWVDPLGLAGDCCAGAAEGSGTVFDSIKSTQTVYSGSVIPKSFEMSLDNGKKVWVHGNATEHMAEYAASKAVTHTPDAVRIVSQQQLRSFQSAVNTATEGNKLPTIIHARYTGAH